MPSYIVTLRVAVKVADAANETDATRVAEDCLDCASIRWVDRYGRVVWVCADNEPQATVKEEPLADWEKG